MRSWSIIAFLLVTIGVLATAAPGDETAADAAWIDEVVPEAYRTLVKESLDLAGENAPEIEAFLRNAEPAHRKAASFLVAYMPPSDLAVATAECLAEHLDYAFRAREELPWASRPTEDMFLHFVLPYRATQEPIAAWRKYLYERIAPRVKHLDSMEDVALELNRWCGERFTYKPSQRRDQGVFENLKRGVGRCEEMMILYMAAARAIGLPVRTCSTPLWSTQDSNHAWVEVWCDGTWHYLGACEPADTLDTAWFTVPAQRAPLVLSRVYGVPEETEGLYRVFDRSAVLNTTSVYAETGEVVVPTDPGTDVYFYVFNFGSLRPFARCVADEDGKGRIELGPGEYPFTTCAEDRVTGWGTVTVKPGEVAEVTWGEGPAPEGRVWFRYPKKGKRPARPKKEGDDEEEPAPAPEVEIPPDVWKVENYNPEDYPEVAARIEGHDLEEKVTEALRSSLGNVAALADAIRRVGADDLDDILWLITSLPVLDLIEATPEVLFDHLTYAKVGRALSGTPYDDATWRESVLHPRTGYEPLRAWREEVLRRFHHEIGEDATETARHVNETLAKTLRSIDASSIGSWKDPRDVLISKCGTKSEITGCAVGVLRALGIPARPSDNRAWVEFFDGEDWQPLFPLEPDDFGSRTTSTEVARAYETPGTLALSFVRKGRPVKGFHDFAALRLDGRYWSTKWPDAETDEDGKAVLKLAPGEYLFNTGARNKNGDPYVLFEPVTIRSGEEVRLDVALDLPIEDLDEADLVVRTLEKMPEIELTPLSEAHAEDAGPIVLTVFFTLDNEPCKSMLPRINAFAREAEGLTTTYVYLGADEETLRAFAEEHGMVGGNRILATADAAQVTEALKLPNDGGKPTAMPSVMLVRTEDGRIVFWEEGFNLSIAGTLETVLDRLAEATD